MRKNVTTILLLGLLPAHSGLRQHPVGSEERPRRKKKPIGQDAKKLEKAERLIGSDDFDPDEFASERATSTPIKWLM